jgi:TonB family protein
MALFSRAFAVTISIIAVGIAVNAQEVSRETPPVLVKEVHPVYTKEAKAARIQGMVVLDAVVLKDGAVGDVTIKKSLDQEFGLDEQAIKALKQWKFKPGTKDGKPVDVSVSIEISFTLK